MTIKHINYKGDTYYLHEKRNAAGKSKYYFSKSTEGNLLENIPEKYEIYENPNGQVFLRPESKKIISEKEIEIVKSSIKKYSNLESFKIDVKKNTIVIYEPDQNITEMIKTFSSFGHNNVDKKYCEKFCICITMATQPKIKSRWECLWVLTIVGLQAKSKGLYKAICLKVGI